MIALRVDVTRLFRLVLMGLLPDPAGPDGGDQLPEPSVDRQIADVEFARAG